MKFKKILPLILAIILVATIVILLIFSQNSLTPPQPNIEKETIAEKQSPIDIEKIVLFSSASALNDYSNPWWNLNILQYSDIAIYLKEDEVSIPANSIFLDNFNFIDGPKLGSPICTYISPLNLGKNSSDIYSAKDQKNISFEVKNSSTEETFENPVFFNNFSSPLTFRYINKDILKDYLLNPEDSSSLTFDGSLLQKCSVKKEDISCKISFDINYVVSESESYKYNVIFDVLLENSEQSIFDGNLLETIYPENISITQL